MGLIVRGRKLELFDSSEQVQRSAHPFHRLGSDIVCVTTASYTSDLGCILETMAVPEEPNRCQGLLGAASRQSSRACGFDGNLEETYDRKLQESTATFRFDRGRKFEE